MYNYFDYNINISITWFVTVIRGREYWVGSSDFGGDPLRSKYALNLGKNRKNFEGKIKIHLLAPFFRFLGSGGPKTPIYPSLQKKG